MTRYMADDVQTALSQGPTVDRATAAHGHRLRQPQHRRADLARLVGADITATLDQMARDVRPGTSTRARASARARERARGSARICPSGRSNPFDVVLATSMLQVGVDVTRLGLMLVVGQPKNTAEYIQASSRVGRDAARPGLVITLGNWARPRDLAHYEQFRHYHETFYAQVEALSVTPFSVTSLERGLDGRPRQRGPRARGGSTGRAVAGAPPGASSRATADVDGARRRAGRSDRAGLRRGRRRQRAGSGCSTGSTSGQAARARSRRAAKDAGLRADRRPSKYGPLLIERRRSSTPRAGPQATRHSSWPTRCARCSPRSTCWSARSRRTLFARRAGRGTALAPRPTGGRR